MATPEFFSWAPKPKPLNSTWRTLKLVPTWKNSFPMCKPLHHKSSCRRANGVRQVHSTIWEQASGIRGLVAVPSCQRNRQCFRYSETCSKVLRLGTGFKVHRFYQKGWVGSTLWMAPGVTEVVWLQMLCTRSSIFERPCDAVRKVFSLSCCGERAQNQG